MGTGATVYCLLPSRTMPFDIKFSAPAFDGEEHTIRKTQPDTKFSIRLSYKQFHRIDNIALLSPFRKWTLRMKSIAWSLAFLSMENINSRCDDETWKLEIQRKRFNGKLGLKGDAFSLARWMSCNCISSKKRMLDDGPLENLVLIVKVYIVGLMYRSTVMRILYVALRHCQLIALSRIFFTSHKERKKFPLTFYCPPSHGNCIRTGRRFCLSSSPVQLGLSGIIYQFICHGWHQSPPTRTDTSEAHTEI